MKAYIAGKITGDSGYKKKFAHTKACLEAEGFVVLNPAELPEGIAACGLYANLHSDDGQCRRGGVFAGL